MSGSYSWVESRCSIRGPPLNHSRRKEASREHFQLLLVMRELEERCLAQQANAQALSSHDSGLSSCIVSVMLPSTQFLETVSTDSLDLILDPGRQYTYSTKKPQYYILTSCQLQRSRLPKRTQDLRNNQMTALHASSLRKTASQSMTENSSLYKTRPVLPA